MCSEREGNRESIPISPPLSFPYIGVIASSAPKAPPPKTRSNQSTPGNTRRTTLGTKPEQPIELSSSSDDVDAESETEAAAKSKQRAAILREVDVQKSEASKVRLKQKPTYPATAQYQKLKKDAILRKQTPGEPLSYVMHCELKIQDASGKVNGTAIPRVTRGHGSTTVRCPFDPRSISAFSL